MDVPTFLRTVHARGPNLAWFLGAGASAAGGVPTAGDMIWDFKRLLYCSAERKPVSTCSDLGDPALRARLQAYFNAKGTTYPSAGADDEYAGYFEAAFPAEADRRRYIDRALAGATPSFGHLALAALMSLDRVRVVWTTNFDRLPEDAATAVLRTSGRLTVAAVETGRIAIEALNESRWPVLGKLHGDFQSRRLKNTVDELRDQDAQLRQALVTSCGRFGLVVVGYSGRDASVMDAFEQALDSETPFPGGLFWLQRSGHAPLPRVAALIERARARGVDAHCVEIGTFDELLADVLKLVDQIPMETRELLDTRARRRTAAPLPSSRGGWPVVRLNALRIDPAPASCRLVTCTIGGHREVRKAVADAGVSLVVARRRAGVLALGRDEDVRKAFDPYGITAFDVYAIEPRRLRYESAELGLLYDALVAAMIRELPLRSGRRGNSFVVYADRARATDTLLDPLRRATGGLGGRTGGEINIDWAEAARLRLQYCLDALWLLVEPTIWAEFPRDNVEARPVAADFIRDRVASRFNAKSNDVLDAWCSLLTRGQERSCVRTFGIGDGVDAAFNLHRVSGFTRRAHGQVA